MTTYDAHHPLRGRARFTQRLEQWADQHAVPFLLGTDGLTWRQRRKLADAYGRAMRTTSEDHLRGAAWLNEREARNRQADAEVDEHEQRRDSA